MHPINNKNFGAGAGKLNVKFYDGSAVVTGILVKQMGTTKYRVTKADGSDGKIVRLAQTTDELTALTAGTGPDAALRADLATIEVAVFGGATENVKKLMANKATTIQGSTVTYVRGVAASAAGQGTLTVVANSAPTVANPIPDQTGTVAALFTYVIPANTFADVNGDTLTLSMTPEPGFAFNATTRVVSKGAGLSTVGAKAITITATDTSGATVSDTFNVTLS